MHLLKKKYALNKHVCLLTRLYSNHSCAVATCCHSCHGTTTSTHEYDYKGHTQPCLNSRYTVPRVYNKCIKSISLYYMLLTVPGAHEVLTVPQWSRILPLPFCCNIILLLKLNQNSTQALQIGIPHCLIYKPEDVVRLVYTHYKSVNYTAAQ